jgi:hypothetical protein
LEGGGGEVVEFETLVERCEFLIEAGGVEGTGIGTLLTTDTSFEGECMEKNGELPCDSSVTLYRRTK